jgi:hypothetical protein
VVADYAEGGGDGDGEDEAHAAPDPAPEEQGDGDGDGVEADAAPDKLWGDEIQSDHMDGGEAAGDEEEGADRFPLGEADQEGGEPSHDYANVRNHVEQAGGEAGENGIVHVEQPEENAAGDNHSESDESHAGEIVAKDFAEILESFLDLRAARDGKQLQRAVPDFAFAGEHEEDEEGHEGDFQKNGVDGADAAKDEIADNGGLRSNVGAGGGAGLHGEVGAADAANFGFDVGGGLLEHGAVLGPVCSEVGDALAESIADGYKDGDEDKDHGHRADGAGDVHALKEFDGGVEEIGEEDGEKKGDDDALRVVEKEKNDGGGEYAQAKRGAADADYGGCGRRRFCGRHARTPDRTPLRLQTK